MMMSEIILVTDVPARWPDILTALRQGKHEFVVTDGEQVRAVIIDQARYRQLVATALREDRRQRALALPLAALPDDWEAGFETLERVSAKFDGLSDKEMDSLFGLALDDVRSANQE
jgi:hypothetical protein